MLLPSGKVDAACFAIEKVNIYGALSTTPSRRYVFHVYSTAYVMDKLIDAKLPVGHDTFHYIADGNYPDEASVTKDWQVSYFLIGHERHARFSGLLRFDVDHLCFHDIAN